MSDVSLLNQILALTPAFEKIMPYCARMGSVFVLCRNNGCILGSLASPLHYARAGRVSLAWTGCLTLRLSHREIPMALSYSETGADGALIDGVEFIDQQRHGRLKICRTDPVSKEQWARMLSLCSQSRLPEDALDSLRKTNHLDGTTVCTHCAPARPAPTRRHLSAKIVETFLCDAIDERKTIEITAPCGMARAHQVFQPHSLQWRGEWLIPTNSEACCHLRMTIGTHAVPRTRGGREIVDIFDAGSRLMARIIKSKT